MSHDVKRMGINAGYEGIVNHNQLGNGCEKSFSTSHDEIAYHRGGKGTNFESAEILPIFHKLLEDKRSSHNELQNTQNDSVVMRGKEVCGGKTASMEHSLTNSTNTRNQSVESNGRKAHFNAASAKMRSCPDMSVRCDIVEYL